jgi:ATP-binding cassette subfamily F protein 3
LRNVLGCFLFSEDDVFKKIKVLSGGEKSRVALAKTLISEANFLLLDEPTNHLDFISENILIQALQQYKGTFVTVSHNRHFVSQVANKIWYIEDKQIKEYPGTYDEYEYWKKKLEAESKGAPAPIKKAEPKAKQTQAAPSNEDAKKLKSLNSELKKVEEEITRFELEKKKAEIQLALPDVYSNFEKLRVAQQTFDKVNETLLTATKKWEKLALDIEALEKK